MMVSYVTPELYMPSGEVSFSKVVEIAGGVVNRIYPFAGEVVGMVYIPSIHLSNRPGLKTAGELSVTVSACVDAVFYAYSVDGNGSLKPLL